MPAGGGGSSSNCRCLMLTMCCTPRDAEFLASSGGGGGAWDRQIRNTSEASVIDTRASSLRLTSPKVWRRFGRLSTRTASVVTQLDRSCSSRAARERERERERERGRAVAMTHVRACRLRHTTSSAEEDANLTCAMNSADRDKKESSEDG